MTWGDRQSLSAPEISWIFQIVIDVKPNIEMDLWFGVSLQFPALLSPSQVVSILPVSSSSSVPLGLILVWKGCSSRGDSTTFHPSGTRVSSVSAGLLSYFIVSGFHLWDIVLPGSPLHTFFFSARMRASCGFCHMTKTAAVSPHTVLGVKKTQSVPLGWDSFFRGL